MSIPIHRFCPDVMSEEPGLFQNDLDRCGPVSCLRSAPQSYVAVRVHVGQAGHCARSTHQQASVDDYLVPGEDGEVFEPGRLTEQHTETDVVAARILHAGDDSLATELD